jgi:ribosomal protein L7/L12
METWNSLMPLIFIILLFVVFYSSSDKKQIKRLERRLNRSERILGQIAENLEIDIHSISDEDKDIADLIQRDRKIEAIKRAREIYGFGLKEAKDYVEDLSEKI